VHSHFVQLVLVVHLFKAFSVTTNRTVEMP